jgi:phosphopantetheinyl transferase (holo-ACP synthase)
MIGVDITTISRFKDIDFLSRFLKKFNVDGKDAVSAAKTWACLEAITKAEGGVINYSNIKILFPKKKSPEVIDSEKKLSGTYKLTLSHENDTVVAVAFREEKYPE